MVVMIAAPARADKKRDAELAREHTQRATVAYNLEHFDEAVQEFEAADKHAEKWREELERAAAAAPASAERAPEPASAPTAPAAPARPEAAAPATDAPAPRGAPILEIDIGPRILWRAFAYTSSAPPMAGYLLNFTPVLGGRLSLFPAAHTGGVLRYLGLLASIEAATWMRSEGFATGTSDVVAGAQARVPAAFGQLGGSVAFFRHAFVLRDTADPTDQSRVELTFPNTTYVGVRFGVGGRINLGRRVVLALEGGYRLVANPGEGVGLVRSTEYFPTGYVSYGLDGGASLGVRLFPWCLARVGIDHRRYVFGPLRGETRSAAGATDAYMAVSLSVVGELGAHSQLRSGR
jgi:hypothetical protein